MWTSQAGVLTHAFIVNWNVMWFVGGEIQIEIENFSCTANTDSGVYTKPNEFKFTRFFNKFSISLWRKANALNVTLYYSGSLSAVHRIFYILIYNMCIYIYNLQTRVSLLHSSSMYRGTIWIWHGNYLYPSDCQWQPLVGQ